MTATRDLCAAVDTRIRITDALKIAGYDGPLDIPEGTSYKTWCPWNDEHPRGTDRSLRIYPDTNSACCFETHGYLTPTRVLAKHANKPLRETALRLYHKLMPSPYERFDALASSRQELNLTALAQAAIVAITGSGADPLNEEIRNTLDRRLQLLATVTTEEQARAWIAELKGEVSRRITCPEAS